MVRVIDLDGDGWLTAEDFMSNAETLAVLQRHGKWEDDVVARWRSYLGGWWDILSAELIPASAHLHNEVHLRYFLSQKVRMTPRTITLN